MFYRSGIDDLCSFLQANKEQDYQRIVNLSYSRPLIGVTQGWKVERRYLEMYSGKIEKNCREVSKLLLEMYLMACCREIAFKDYETNPLIVFCCQKYHLAKLQPDYKMMFGRLSLFLPLSYDNSGVDLANYFHNKTTFELLDPILEFLEQRIIPANPQLASRRKLGLEAFNSAFHRRRLRAHLIICLTKIEDIVMGIKWDKMAPRPSELSHLVLDQDYETLLLHPLVQKHKEMYGIVTLTTLEHFPACPSLPHLELVQLAAAIVIISFIYDLQGEIEFQGYQSTLLDEFHRLLSNLCQASCWAGHQYQMMTADVELGEKIALEYVQNIMNSHVEKLKIYIPLWDGRCEVLENDLTQTLYSDYQHSEEFGV